MCVCFCFRGPPVEQIVPEHVVSVLPVSSCSGIGPKDEVKKMVLSYLFQNHMSKDYIVGKQKTRNQTFSVSLNNLSYYGHTNYQKKVDYDHIK